MSDKKNNELKLIKLVLCKVFIFKFNKEIKYTNLDKYKNKFEY